MRASRPAHAVAIAIVVIFMVAVDVVAVVMAAVDAIVMAAVDAPGVGVGAGGAVADVAVHAHAAYLLQYPGRSRTIVVVVVVVVVVPGTLTPHSRLWPCRYIVDVAIHQRRHRPAQQLPYFTTGGSTRVPFAIRTIGRKVPDDEMSPTDVGLGPSQCCPWGLPPRTTGG